MDETKNQDWDKLVLDVSLHPNYQQSDIWAKTKYDGPWTLSRLIINNSLPLQVFSRSIRGLGLVNYAPQVSCITPQNIPLLTKEIKEKYKKGLVFKLDTYLPYSEELVSAFKANGWHEGRSVGYRNTVVANLGGSEEDMFMKLKRRARYEVGVAKKNNVSVEKVEPSNANFDKLAELLDFTSKRTGAFIRHHSYLYKVWKIFTEAGYGDIYLVWHDKTLLAGTFIIKYGQNAWYKDSGSTGHESKLMASRLMLWEIMLDLQKQGIKSFDLSGIPAEEDMETSSLRGLYTFKTGFSNETLKLMPAMELPLSMRHKIWPRSEKLYLRLYSGIKKDFWY